MQNYVYTDTFIYHIEWNDVNETMKRDIAKFDEQLPADNMYGPLVNKKSTRSKRRKQWRDNDRIHWA